MALAGRATAAGTARYAQRFVGRAVPEHFRTALGLTLSSIGAGTSLGDMTDAVDRGYRDVLAEAVRHGCNVLDTAVSYRAQRSEVALGQAIADLVGAGEVARDELVIASKGGFIAYRDTPPANRVQYVYENFVATGLAEPDELAGGIHCLAPGYLSQQIIWSLRNLGLHTIDIYCIHNPETQLTFVDRATFRQRVRLAFARLEEEVMAGRIGCYGVATWEGLRRAPVAEDYVSLEMLLQTAVEIAGAGHHFKVVQVPVNAQMTEAVLFRNQPVGSSLMPTLQAARQLGLVVMASASLMQAQLAKGLPAAVAEAFPELSGGAQRALQFARSLPGVTTALVGTTSADHAREDLALKAYPPEPEKAERAARLLPR